MERIEFQTSLDQRRHQIADRVKQLIAAADGQRLGPGDIAFRAVKRAWHVAVEIIIGHGQFPRLLIAECGRRRMSFGQIETPARPGKVGDDARPFGDIGKPDQGALGDKHQIETIRDQG